MSCPGSWPEVLVVAAGVLVRDQAIHGGGDPGADREAGDHQREAPQVKDAPFVDAAHRLGDQAQRRRRQHQPCPEAQDSVVGLPRQLAHEQERQRPQAGGQPGDGGGKSSGTQGQGTIYRDDVGARDDATTVYLAFGANLGDRAGTIARAIELLAAGGVAPRARSPLYETDPVTPDPQPPYLNAVVRAETALSPPRAAGALPGGRAGARPPPPRRPRARRRAESTSTSCSTAARSIADPPSLIVPHPRLLERPFVRIPLGDVAAARPAPPRHRRAARSRSARSVSERAKQLKRQPAPEVFDGGRQPLFQRDLGAPVVEQLLGARDVGLAAGRDRPWAAAP